MIRSLEGLWYDMILRTSAMIIKNGSICSYSVSTYGLTLDTLYVGSIEYLWFKVLLWVT